MDHAFGLRDRPFQALAEAFADFGRQVLPACVAVLARNHELRVALRQRQVGMWQMRARTRDGSGVPGGDVTREPLGLFTEGVERRTGWERLRSGHGAPLSRLAC